MRGATSNTFYLKRNKKAGYHRVPGLKSKISYEITSFLMD